MGLKSQPDLHLNIEGGDLEEYANIVLWHCQPHLHETFEFEDGMIRIRDSDGCLHAEGGLQAGSPLVAWKCSEGIPGDNELFAYDKSRSVIYSLKEPTLGFNI